VNGEDVPVEKTGLEGRIASKIERNGVGSCVVIQVGLGGNSYSFAFPAGCAGGGGGGSAGGGSRPAELDRLEGIYHASLADIERNAAAIRRAVLEFIKSL
jgi:hypothetical protein